MKPKPSNTDLHVKIKPSYDDLRIRAEVEQWCITCTHYVAIDALAVTLQDCMPTCDIDGRVALNRCNLYIYNSTWEEKFNTNV